MAIANIAITTVTNDVINSFAIFSNRPTSGVMNIYLVIFLTLLAALVTSYSQLLFKRGLKKRLNSIRDILGTLMNKTIIIGLLGYVLSFTLYLIALSKSQLSIVFPIFASSFIFVTLISAVTLKERTTTARVLGILLIFLGIVMVTATA